MKTKQLLSAMLVFTAVMTSCKKDDFEKNKSVKDSGVEFTSRIMGDLATKASGNRWDANDEIGVFMKQGVGLSEVLGANKKFTTKGNGNFSSTGDDILNHPAKGQVDFIAYYPFSAAVSKNSVEINVADQKNQAKIDVMYSDNARGLNKKSGTAKLEFSHMLSKVEILVKAGTGIANLTGLKAGLTSIPTKSLLDLATGKINQGSTEVNVDAKVSVQKADQLVEAILIPGNYEGKKIVFSIANDNYTWTIPANTKLESGKRYAYSVTLLGSKAVKLEGNATITNWIAVPSGQVDVIQAD